MYLQMHNSLQLKAFISLLVCLLLAACGQKGALYVPQPDQQSTVGSEALPEPDSAQPLSFAEQQELLAEEENGIPEPAGSDEATVAVPNAAREAATE